MTAHDPGDAAEGSSNHDQAIGELSANSRRTRRIGLVFVSLFVLVVGLAAFEVRQLGHAQRDYQAATFPVTDLANLQRQAERLRSSVNLQDRDALDLDVALLDRQIDVAIGNSRRVGRTESIEQIVRSYDLLVEAANPGSSASPFDDEGRLAALRSAADQMSLSAKVAYDAEEQAFIDLMIVGIDQSGQLALTLALLGVVTLMAGAAFFLRLQRGNREGLEAANDQLLVEVRERRAGESRLALALEEASRSEADAMRGAEELAMLHGIVVAGVGGGVLAATGRIAEELVGLHGFPMVAIVLDDQEGRPYTAAICGPTDVASWVGQEAIVSEGGLLAGVLAGGAAREIPVPPGMATAVPNATALQIAPIHGGGGRTGALITEVADHTGPVMSLPSLRRLADQIGVLVEAARGYDDQVRLAEKFRELDQLKTEFVATVSHELRTPLTAIVGMAMTLDQFWDRVGEDERRDMVARMRRQARRQQRLVDDLLTVSRLQEGRVTVRREAVDVRSVADTVARDLEVEVDIDLPGDAVVLADRDHVERILTNYVTNAVKYAGGVGIAISSSPLGDQLELVVSDQGPGVPEEFRARLFDSFTQASIGSTRTSQGVGLGLSIVRTLAAANQGEAWYRPRDGGGSRFGVTLARPGTLTTSSVGIDTVDVG